MPLSAAHHNALAAAEAAAVTAADALSMYSPTPQILAVLDTFITALDQAGVRAPVNDRIRVSTNAMCSFSSAQAKQNYYAALQPPATNQEMAANTPAAPIWNLIHRVAQSEVVLVASESNIVSGASNQWHLCCLVRPANTNTWTAFTTVFYGALIPTDLVSTETRRGSPAGLANVLRGAGPYVAHAPRDQHAIRDRRLRIAAATSIDTSAGGTVAQVPVALQQSCVRASVLAAIAVIAAEMRSDQPLTAAQIKSAVDNLWQTRPNLATTATQIVTVRP